MTEAARQVYRGAVSEGVVVIVGGTSGLGLRLAEKYAARGTDVVITRGANTIGPRQYPEKLVPLFVTNALQ